MAKDRTIGERTKRQRERRHAAGWKEIRIWVPSEDAAKVIKSAAAKMRLQAANWPEENEPVDTD